MRRISRVAIIALSSLFVTTGFVAAGCGDGDQTTTTTKGTSSSSSGGSAGEGGTAGGGGTNTGGKAGAAGMGGDAGGSGGFGGSGGAGGAGGASCTDEVCDGVDNDCDNQIDEGCLCKLGDTQSCYDADPATLDVGACMAGTKTCDLTGTFGACEGQVVPSDEACNGKDDNCDGNVDDGFAPITCGIGACQVTVDGCSMGVPGDCVPLAPSPKEACDGTDDNCDGKVDEGCSCVDNQTQSCYTGPNGTEGTGACAAGTQTCAGGMWGPCVGDVLPSPETCNAIDDDCDGQKDEELGVSVCGTGACHVMVDNCANGQTQTCVPGNPQAETCNGIDDDCDVAIDEELGTVSCGVGACLATVNACVNGQPNTCVPGMSSVEVCDGIDNDCNGAIDNGNPGGGGACMTGNLGVCAAGVLQCTGGQIVCAQSAQPSLEFCDGLDNDCNGMVDDNAAQVGAPCTTGQQGVCAAGTRACTNGMLVCVPNTMASIEVCDGLDNDCNGQADNGNPGGNQSCNTGNLGICAAGSTSCVNGLIVCNQNTAPNVELCDGLDNNCNGQVDDNAQQVGTPCTTGQQGVCSPGTRACTNGALVCNRNVNPTPEVCDALDNDCDGSVDESAATVGDPCPTGLNGVCAAGTKVCNNGTISCNQTTQSSAEICDGLDNDCNGVVDNGNPGGGQSCSTGQQGVCGPGTTSCTNGAIVCNRNTNPSSEVCDNRDNDCNGIVDDNPATVGDPCTTGLPGVCSAGLKVCNNGTISCSQTTQSSAETCDGLDNDCNGVADNGNPGGGMSCSTGQLGVCGPGTTACSNGTIACNRNTSPTSEVCDNQDNDCDGIVDDNPATVGDPCMTGFPGVCSAGLKVCNNGSISCSQTTQSSAETCDGLDNDCNGVADNGNPGGGASCNTGQSGVCGPGTTSCTGGAVVCNRNVNPTAEVCDGLDNDCNGVNDNGLPGGGMPCNTGEQGICAAGSTSCSGGTIVCVRNSNPIPEVCDGLDNNCNGMVDDNPATVGDPCTTGLPGVCSAGVKVCMNGAIVCSQTTQSSAEVCDGLDNDCNGVVDNGNPGGAMPCSTGQSGICSTGTTACTNGAIVCNRDNNPTSEICDGLDNDCNGQVDNGNPGGGASCNTGQQGICSAGTTACTNGSIACNRNNNPTTETCDGLDNDCNGQVDNGNPGGGVSCNTGQSGICAAGTTSCTNGSIACNRNNNPTAEVCDGLDNDCDNLVDDGNPGSGMSCSTGQSGVCSAGTTSCTNGSIACNRNVNPTTETCDGLDNDCNGQVDNGNPGGGISCNTGQSGVCSAGTTVCSMGMVACNRNTGPTTEVCDGLDNDCNGQVDNGNPGGGLACVTGQFGICSAGTTVCSGGASVCNRNNNPVTEICDGLDNDCDGALDENAPNTMCGSQNPGAGGVSTWACSSGACSITGCTAGNVNIDGAINNGCECMTDTYANTCAAATSVNVTVGSTINLTGKIETASGSDWVLVVFTDRPTGQAYHPKIELTTNPGGQYAMDVQSACGTPAACSPAGNGMNTESGGNITLWEHYNSGYIAGAGCCSDNTTHVTSEYVRIYRKTGNAPTCNAYVVTVSNL